MTEDQAEPEPQDAAPATSSGAAATWLGQALNFVGDKHVAWIMATAAAFGSIMYFFSVDKGLTAFFATIASFATLPMGVMAKSFVTRNLPLAPVVSALAGAAFGGSYGLVAALSAARYGGWSAYLACVAFPIICGSIGFVLLGGIANVATSRPRA